MLSDHDEKTFEVFFLRVCQFITLSVPANVNVSLVSLSLLLDLGVVTSYFVFH